MGLLMFLVLLATGSFVSYRFSAAARTRPIR